MTENAHISNRVQEVGELMQIYDQCNDSQQELELNTSYIKDVNIADDKSGIVDESPLKEDETSV